MVNFKCPKRLPLYSLLTLFIGFLPPAYSQPTVLELKVLQTRVFDVTPQKFLTGAGEMCRNHGGSPVGLDPTYVSQLSSGNLSCHGMKGKFNFSKVSFEGQKENNLGLVIRMRIDYMGGPSYEKKHYDDLVKEISDTIGVQDIPIRLDQAK